MRGSNTSSLPTLGSQHGPGPGPLQALRTRWHLHPSAKAAASLTPQGWHHTEELTQTFPSGLFFICKIEGCRQPRALLSHPLHPPHPQHDLPPLPTARFPSQSHRQAELGGSSSPGPPRRLLGAQGQEQRPLCVCSPSCSCCPCPSTLHLRSLRCWGGSTERSEGCPSSAWEQVRLHLLLLGSGSLQDRCHCISYFQLAAKCLTSYFICA